MNKPQSQVDQVLFSYQHHPSPLRHKYRCIVLCMCMHIYCVYHIVYVILAIVVTTAIADICILLFVLSVPYVYMYTYTRKISYIYVYTHIHTYICIYILHSVHIYIYLYMCTCYRAPTLDGALPLLGACCGYIRGALGSWLLCRGLASARPSVTRNRLNHVILKRSSRCVYIYVHDCVHVCASVFLDMSLFSIHTYIQIKT